MYILCLKVHGWNSCSDLMKKCSSESSRLIKLSTAIYYTTHDDNIFKRLHIALVQRQTQTRPTTSDVSVRVFKRDLAFVSEYA